MTDRTTHRQTLQTLVDQIDETLAVCDGWLRENSWRFVEQMATNRGRAAATLRAMMRWYDKAPTTPRPLACKTPVELDRLVDANRALVQAYETALEAVGPGAPESRLLEEQLRTLRAERAELASHLAPARYQPRNLRGQQASA